MISERRGTTHDTHDSALLDYVSGGITVTFDEIWGGRRRAGSSEAAHRSAPASSVERQAYHADAREAQASGGVAASGEQLP